MCHFHFVYWACCSYYGNACLCRSILVTFLCCLYLGVIMETFFGQQRFVVGREWLFVVSVDGCCVLELPDVVANRFSLFIGAVCCQGIWKVHTKEDFIASYAVSTVSFLFFWFVLCYCDFSWFRVSSFSSSCVDLAWLGLCCFPVNFPASVSTGDGSWGAPPPRRKVWCIRPCHGAGVGWPTVVGYLGHNRLFFFKTVYTYY